MALYGAPPPPLTLGSEEHNDIVEQLEGYRIEADQNRKSGLNPRDEKWSQNLNLYWNRYDFSKKAGWQAKEVMPEVPNFVDRFAAAMKEALVATPNGFYTVDDPYDQEQDLAGAIKRMNDIWLTTIGRSQTGATLGFPAMFEEQMKMGALMACSGVVTWKEDVPYGRVAFETVDPRFVWLDHTYRDLYRIRRVEMDRHDLGELIHAKTNKGNPVFNLDEVNSLITSLVADDQRYREEATGHGHEERSGRNIITLDEYVATVLDKRTGQVLGDRHSLFVVANNKFLVRGPEKNPYMHGKDWLVYAPLVTAPLSVYGRSYMEDFGSVANTFTELTNMILDAVHTAALKAFIMVPSMLADPGQVTTGITPNKIFLLEEGFTPDEFAKELNLGTVDPAMISFWQQMKAELSEAAGINEIGLGQFAPKGRTSATEIQETQASSSALIRSVAQTVETRFLDVVLDLTWKTGVQHMKKNDRRLSAAAGDQLYGALLNRRSELLRHPVTFQARGISTLIQKSQMLSKIMNLLQVIAQNENLLAAFMQVIDVNKLLNLLFNLSNVDITKLQASPREQMVQGLLAPVMERANQGTPSAAGLNEMSSVANSMGIAR